MTRWLGAACLFAWVFSAQLAVAETGRRAGVAFVSTDAEFPNPERGFWRFAAEDFASVSADELRDIRAAGMTMAYAIVRLDAFRGRALTPAFTARLGQAFGRARAAGVKVILRFAYNYPETEEDYENAEDAPLSVVLGHIGQIAPVLARNADVVAVWQAGFIGAWGEAHTSSNGLDRPGPKRIIRDALLQALPPGRLLQWRYPADLIAWSAEPGPGGDFPRIGFHNDCFLSSPTDVGTFSERPRIRARQRAYAAELTRTTMFGGETCEIEGTRRRTSCAAILNEGAAFHLTTLNRDYFRGFHTRWKRDGCFGEVSRRMGYRLELTAASIDRTAARGETATAVVRLRNVGWARPANRRPLQLVLSHSASGETYRLATGDLRGVDPADRSPDTFAFAWMVPHEVPTGRYDVAVAAPDPAPRLAARAEFAVRFANTDAAARGQGWDAARAVFETGLSVTVAR